MEKINFVNNQAPAINDTNLNQLQTNVENAIDKVNAFKNLFNINEYPIIPNKVQYNGNSESWAGYSGIVNYFPVEPNTTYTVSNNKNLTIHNGGLTFYDSSKSVLSYTGNVSTFTTPENCAFIRFSFYSTEITWVQIEENPFATGYVPYVPKNVSDVIKWRDDAVFNSTDNTITVPIPWDSLKEISFRALGNDYASFGFLTIPKELWHNNGTYEIDVKCYDTSNNYVGYKRFKVTTKNTNNFVITMSGNASNVLVLYK